MMNLYCALFALFCSAYVFAEDRSAKPTLPLPDDVASVSSLQSKQAKIDAALKERDLDIACYGGPQTLTLAEGQTHAVRIQWNIPISKLAVGDKIRVQLKSVNGANAAASAFYKYASTRLEGVVWTLNADGFYYSQLIEIAVAQSDLDAYTTFPF